MSIDSRKTKKEIKNIIRSYFRQKNIEVNRERISDWDIYYTININGIDVKLDPFMKFIIDVTVSDHDTSYKFKIIDFSIIEKCKSICKKKDEYQEDNSAMIILQKMME